MFFVCLYSCKQPLSRTSIASIPKNAIPFEYVNHIYLQCKLNDTVTAQLVFDTGASGIRLDSSFLAQHHIKTFDGTETSYKDKVYQKGAGGGVMQVRFAKNTKLSLDTLQFNFDLAPVMNLDPILAPALGHKIDGILGYDVLLKYVTEINYEKKYLILHDPDKLDRRLFSGYTKLSYTKGLEIKIKLNDSITLNGQFGVDIGKGGALSFHTATVRNYDLVNKLGPLSLHSSARNIGGLVQEYFYRAQSISLDTFILQRPIVSLSQNTKGATSGGTKTDMKVGGIVGNEVFERFDVIFDFVKKDIYLKPNKNFKDPFGYTTVGFFVEDRTPDLKAYQVSLVLPNSPASEAKLVEGDLIVEIEGKRSEDLSFNRVTKLLQETNGSPLFITISRNGQNLKLKVNRRSALP